MVLAAGTKLGPYEIAAPLGAGGMGEVYQARDTKLDRRVAVKVLPAHLSGDPTSLSRFEREAKTVAATSHPNILAIFDFGTSQGVAYAVSELLEGETLRAHLAAGPLPIRKTIEYAAQIAEGLGAAHDRGIVHRDLKPENLFVTSDGRVKILDFGLARQHAVLSTDDTSSPTLSRYTQPGTVMGTVGYMSPEQVRGLEVDARSDIFSFGAVLYEMVSGRRAFQGESAAETMHAILKQDPPGLLEEHSNLPPALERIVVHCLEKRPEQRFHSAHDLAFDLKALTTPSGAGTTRPTSTGASERLKRPLARLGLLAAGVSLGVSADRTLHTRLPAEPPTYRRLTFDRGTMGLARFAPDGNSVVYNAAWRGQRSEIFTARLDSRESRTLGLTDAMLFAISSTSELAVGLGASDPRFASATLSRVPLAGGAPRGVLNDVAWADWSPDGAELAVIRIVGGRVRVEYPIGKTLYETDGDVTHVRVSPKGDSLVFIDRPPAAALGPGSVVAMDRSGTKKTLSSGWADLFGLAWRPDGREVWFTAARRGETKALYAVTLSGRERLVARTMGQFDLHDISRDGRVLATHPNFRIEVMSTAPGASKERDLTWLGMSMAQDISEDGSRVLIEEYPEGAGEGSLTYLRQTDGSPAVRLGEGSPLALSPDGKWALSLRTSPSRLVVLPTSVGEARELTRPGMTYRRWGRWFPDSRRVVYTADTDGGTRRVYLQDIEGDEPRPLGPEGMQQPLVAPDAQTIAGLADDGKFLLLPVAGGDSRAIQGLGPEDTLVQWSAHGLYYQRWKGLTALIYRLDLGTGRTELVRELSPPDPAGASPPYVVLTRDAGSYAYSYTRDVSELYLVEGLK